MIDDFSKYELFYINGASAFEGGGLEESNIKHNSYEPLYRKKYNVNWKNRNEINFGKRLSEIIGMPCINDAISGSGTERLVRTTYDFIFKNWKRKDKFFIIIEPLDAARSYVFLNEINDYFIVNSDICFHGIIAYNLIYQKYNKIITLLLNSIKLNEEDGTSQFIDLCRDDETKALELLNSAIEKWVPYSKTLIKEVIVD
jgi:hypothetical protein